MNIAIMVPLVSFLAALRILTEAQICNNGEGKVSYEKIVTNRFTEFNSDLTLNNSSSLHEIITRNDLPLKVLEECFQRCQEDKLSKLSTCAKFDFLPGKRRFDSNIQDQGVKGKSLVEQLKSSYEPSKCVFYPDLNATIDLTELQPNHGSVWHFNEVCLSAQSINRICPNRAYVVERITGFRLVDNNAKEVVAADKAECENKCLTERLFTCRAASFDRRANKCFLSQSNRHVLPNSFKPEPDYEYLENMCLKHNEMCKWNVLIIETGKQLESEFEKSLIPSNSVNNCTSHCLESLDKYGFVCRSFMFDEESQSCALYDEDPLEQMGIENETNRRLVPSKGNLYRVLCSSDDKAKELDNKTLECYRHKRLRGRHQVELSTTNFYDCLSSCLKRYAKMCRSIEYSHPRQVCRFSGYSVAGPFSDKDNDALIDDETFDYYQFMWNDAPTGVQDKFSSADQLNDRQDSIEVSNSQPGVYGNFIVPIEQTRDHHRGGFAYSQTEYPVKSPPTRYRDPPVYQTRPVTNQPRPVPPPPYQPQQNTYSTSNGYSIGRTPMNSVPVHNRFVGYGIPPYMSHSQNSVSQVSYTSLPPLPAQSVNDISGSVSISSSSVSNDRYGGTGSTRPDGNGLSSISGCKYDSMQSDISKFRRVGFSARLKSKHIYKVVRADRLEDCERFCLETKDFVCKSFNFRAFFPDNCELSSADTKKFKLENADHFEHNTQFDYYERTERKSLMTPNAMDCFEVLQACSPEGMELKLKTTEGFYGRIYTYGFYDSCFFDGNGATESSLRISKPNGFPRCGTQQVGDAMTNIVVVQFNDYVQTSRDKKYNLTCYISGPGEAVVTSNYLDTKTDGRHPMQIEHLPAQNILTSNIVLRILYRGTPTNTIVVGDLLTFRLEARNQCELYLQYLNGANKSILDRFNGYHNDIFASNVIAKDPYTGRQVLLVDSRGCPVDLFVFPELHKTPDGALEAEFYAFKIPDSNFLVFQATVKTCKGPCEPVICNDRGRGQSSFPSWGRRKRSIRANRLKPKADRNNSTKAEVEEVHELLQVYLTHEDVPEAKKLEKSTAPLDIGKVCVDKFAYYSLVMLSALFVLLFVVLLPYWAVVKMAHLKYQSKHNRFGQWPVGWFNQHQQHQVPSLSIQRTSPHFVAGEKRDFFSEPIYCDPSVLERSRSLQSLTVQDTNKIVT